MFVLNKVFCEQALVISKSSIQLVLVSVISGRYCYASVYCHSIRLEDLKSECKLFIALFYVGVSREGSNNC